MKKNLIIAIVAIVIVGALSFFSGWQLGRAGNGGRGNFDPQNFSGGANRQGMNRAGGGGLTNGEILSKNDQSLTLKLRDGGSKIILLSSSTQIMKDAPGTMTDLGVGQSIMVAGTANADGSLTAQMVQLRPKNIDQNNVPTSTDQLIK